MNTAYFCAQWSIKLSLEVNEVAQKAFNFTEISSFLGPLPVYKDHTVVGITTVLLYNAFKIIAKTLEEITADTKVSL